MATPFQGKTFTFTQPDGTPFQVRGWGNQNYAVFETLDGYTVVPNPDTGFYELARLSADGTQLEPAGVPVGGTGAALEAVRPGIRPGLRVRTEAAHAAGLEGARRLGGRRCDERWRERKNLARALRHLDGGLEAPPRRATVGNFVGLCLLIDFSDEPGTIPREEVEKFCNQSGYTGFGNNGSVSDYFKANSIGRLRYTNVVAPYYRAQRPKTYYTNPNIAQGVRARELIREALTHLKANGFDFSPLTADADGFVYAMNVYYAGEVVNNWAEGLWPHAWHLGTRFPLTPGKDAFDYQFTDMSHQLTLGTFCHENGHMLCDYPDLYDYGNESSGVGAFCLMCAGGNISEKNPAHVAAYLKRLSGWANSVTTIQHGQQVSLAAGANDFALFAKTATEYFLVENRARAGRDVALPDEGLAIWHVDETGDNSNEHRTPAQHYELSLEQADGAFKLETSAGQFGDATDLFGRTVKRFADSTTPNSKWWDGTASNLDLFEISAPGPTVTFRARLSNDPEATRTVRADSAPGRSIPDNRADGITDTFTIAETGVIAGVQVSLDITHPYRGDVQVTLRAPWGATVLLHPRNQGGGADDIRRTIREADLPALAALHGKNVQGAWQLVVQDLAPADVGTLNRWGLEFTVTGPRGKVVLEEAPGTHIPDNDPAGIERTRATTAAGAVAAVEVAVDLSHTYIGDLRVSLHSPAGTEVVLHGQAEGSADDLVKTFTAATTPGLGVLAGQPIAGTWRLRVSDRAGQDVGKLNGWRLTIQPA